ncbi:hypothetical protein BU17DRAFT_89058 [Hysterangium stoloniferum]|nr:hypothetical protein BU17DRAFT_89058 [Hysterangium stoloniferum]
MATQVFPNTVFVDRFPGSASRHDFMVTFGGPDRHIQEVIFTNVPGESRKAFIIYEHHSSVGHALSLNGTRFNRSSAGDLVVKVVDEKMLCQIVPGERKDTWKALEDLKSVFAVVLDARDQAQRDLAAARAENRRLTHGLSAARSRNATLKVEQDALAQTLRDAPVRAVGGGGGGGVPRAAERAHTPTACLPDSKNGSGAPLSDCTDPACRKRRRDENVQTAEPPVKRRLVYRDQPAQTCTAPAQRGAAEDPVVCRDGRKDAEALLREARAELDKVMVFDSLLAAFRRMDRLAKQAVEAANTPDTENHASVHDDIGVVS